MESSPRLVNLIGQVFDGLKADSDPGFPLRNIAASNSIAIENYRGLIIESVIARLNELTSKDVLSYGSIELLERGVCDPVRIFVKNEPHSSKKLEQGRVRLIMSVSLVDQVVSRILFSTQNRAEVDAWKDIPSKPGMGFSDEQTESIFEYVDDFPDLESYDVSGWDWSVQDWEMAWEAESRIMLAGAEETLFATVVRNYFHTASRSVFVLADGSLYAQTIAGIMKSGLYITSPSNSRIIVRTSHTCGVRKIMSNGDDHVANRVEDYVSSMLRRGHIVVPEEVSEGFNFCSHHYKDGVCWTTNADKITFALLNKSGTPAEKAALYDDWLRDMYRHPALSMWEGIISLSGWLSDPKVD